MDLFFMLFLLDNAIGSRNSLLLLSLFRSTLLNSGLITKNRRVVRSTYIASFSIFIGSIIGLNGIFSKYIIVWSIFPNPISFIYKPP